MGSLLVSPFFIQAQVSVTGLREETKARFLKALNQEESSFRVLSKHSFSVQPDNFAFIPVKTSTGRQGHKLYVYSLSDVKIISLKQDGENRCAITEIFRFDKVEAVSFKDLDKNGKADILVITSYRDNRPSQGDGVGNNSKHYVGTIYLRKKGKFQLEDDCFEEKSIRKLAKAFRSRQS